VFVSGAAAVVIGATALRGDGDLQAALQPLARALRGGAASPARGRLGRMSRSCRHAQRLRGRGCSLSPRRVAAPQRPALHATAVGAPVDEGQGSSVEVHGAAPGAEGGKRGRHGVEFVPWGALYCNNDTVVKVVGEAPAEVTPSAAGRQHGPGDGARRFGDGSVHGPRDRANERSAQRRLPAPGAPAPRGDAAVR
jgi:hypothetical protein